MNLKIDQNLMSDSQTKILISACLLGETVRYDAKNIRLTNQYIHRWNKQKQIISFCPEVAGGLSIPRAPAEIVGGSGRDVLLERGKVINNKQQDVTAAFLKGAELALIQCVEHKIKVAVLTENSPSCGGLEIYNGEFTRSKISGEGVTTALLRKNGIKVFNQYQWAEAEQALGLNS